MIQKSEIIIKGLHCIDCVHKVERGLSASAGVQDLNINFTTGKLHIEYDDATISLNEIHARIRSLGHEVLEEEVKQEESNLFTLKNPGFVLPLVSGIMFILGLFLHHSPDSIVSNPLLYEPEAFHNIHGSTIFFFLAMITGGYQSAKGAISGLRNKVFVIDALMLIGALGAVALGEFGEGAAVLFLFSLAELLEDYSVDRSRRSLRELVGLTPDMVFIKTENGSGNGLKEITANEVKLGDIAVVRPGERIGVDGIVLTGCSMVNQAPITGESMPIRKNPGDTVFAGTINQDGGLEIRVEKEAKDSALARIIQMVESAEEHKSDTERFVNKFSKYFTPSVVIMAILVSTIPPLVFDQSFDVWFYKALLLLLISCPCALALSTPITIVSGITKGARNGLLFKGGVYLEKLETIDTFAFDKTGTLTEGRPVVTDILPMNGYSRTDILTTAASLEAMSHHPLGTAIVELAVKENITIQPVVDLHETTGKGIEGMIGGERRIVGSLRLFEQGALTKLDRSKDVGNNEGADSGEGVLSTLEEQGKTAVIVGSSTEVMGIIGITDKIRDGAREMVRALREMGISRLVMITGDNERTAKAVATAVGIDEYHAELLPDQKVNVIEGLINRNSTDSSTSKVAMVGDGVNDAPALVTADLGIAMGAAGSDTALEVADIALMNEDLMNIPVLLSLGRRTMSVVRQNIIIAIGVKLVFAILVFPGLVTLWMAVAIGDMGVSLTVIANALRLTRKDKFVREDSDPTQENDLVTGINMGEAQKVSGCHSPGCSDGCCGESTEQHDQETLSHEGEDDCDCCSQDTCDENHDHEHPGH